MKSAKMTAVAVELACPHCGEGFEAPNGSFMWTPFEIRGLIPGRPLVCGCGEECGIPRGKSAELA